MAETPRKTSFEPDTKIEKQELEHAPGFNANAFLPPAAFAALSEEQQAALHKSTTRKIDFLILPIVFVLYVLNYLDRQNIASARLAGLEDDLGITDTQYQACISILFGGYIFFQVPSNMVVGRIKWPAWYILAAVALWGAISAATAAVHGYVGLLLCRFFLGCVEACFFPAAIFYLTCWYTKRQMAFRTAILYSGSQFGNAIAGLLAIGLLKLDGAHGLEGWRWLFIVEGVATIGIALLFLPFMPNNPRKALLLTDDEKDLLEYRLRADRAQKAEPEISVGHAFWLVLIDMKTWLFMGMLSILYISTAVSNFFPSVVNTLGYDRTTTYGLTAPPYIFAIIVILLNGFYSDKAQNRFWFAVGPVMLLLVGNVIAVSTLSTAGRYFSMMLLPGSGYASAIVILSWISGSINGPKLKRAITLSLVNAMANTPNIWTSFLYKGAPRYTVAFGVNVAACAACLFFMLLTRLYLSRENRKIEEGRPTGKSGPTEEEVADGFRYPL